MDEQLETATEQKQSAEQIVDSFMREHFSDARFAGYSEDLGRKIALLKMKKPAGHFFDVEKWFGAHFDSAPGSWGAIHDELLRKLPMLAKALGKDSLSGDLTKRVAEAEKAADKAAAENQ